MAPHRVHLRIFAGLLPAAVLVVWLGFKFNWRTTRTPVTPLQPLLRLYLDLGAEMSPSSDPGTSAILSPDGKRLVYISSSKLFSANSLNLKRPSW